MDCNNKVAGCRLPVACVLLLVAAFAFAAPRWRIRTHITVRQSVVRLGDLVNPQAELPASLRALQLGVAPQPGTPLRWSREQFTARLRSAGVAPGEFAIPKVIEIRREAQPVPAAAVLEA
ncbi:MAG: hypothetical protein ACRD1F_05225, partial [Terriglobales bacterium]